MTTITDLSAGDDIDSRCLKCKAVTNHTIIAMDGEHVVKVQCNTCHSRHNYRPPVAEKAKAVRRSAGKVVAGQTAKPRLTKEMKAAVLFDEATAGRDFSEAIPYAMSADFNADDLINHPTFGFGVVAKKISPTRIEVVFKEATKVLVCATS